MKVSIPKISTKPFDIACTAYYMWAPVLRAYPLYLYGYNIGIILDILFSSNHNIHKSSYDFCFWASDPLIDRFYNNLLIKGSEALVIKQGLMYYCTALYSRARY